MKTFVFQYEKVLLDKRLLVCLKTGFIRIRGPPDEILKIKTFKMKRQEENMKYEPKKVFIKESGKYIEITYQEHQQRREKDKEYAKRKFIPVQGCIMKTELTEYKEFHEYFPKK